MKPAEALVEARVLRSVAEIEEIREPWTRWQNDLNADLDFYLMVIQLRKEVVRPHIVLVLCGGHPKAMAVGRLERGSVNIKLGYKSVACFPVLTLHMIHGGLLGEQTPEAAGAILDSLKQSLRNGEAEMLAFSGIPLGSDFDKRLREKVSFLCREHFAEKRIRWKMALGCTVEEMHARFSRDHRQKLRRQAKIFEKDFPGGLAIRCFREPAELDRMAKDVEEVARATYQRGLGVGFIDNEECRSRVAFEARQGWLRMYVLYVKAKPCTYWWGTLYRGTFYSHAIGFDTHYAEFRPGIYIVNKTLAEFCQEGVKGLDFGFGDAQFKQQFGNQHTRELFMNVCAARPRLIALNLMKTLNNGLKAGALAIAGRFNSVQIIKKRWRAKLAPKNDKS